MEEVGMQVRIDPAGNLMGHYPGENPHAPALVTGSHLDTVPNGGIYDGAYGVLAGLEVVRVLAEKQLRLIHPVEVIVFTDEEGTMLGSKAISGSVVAVDSTEVSLEMQARLAQLGGDWGQIAQARRGATEMAAFIELHVEQGPVLEVVGAEIGIVTGIVAQRRFMITVQGQASHAGTTPMSMRRDALVAAAQIVLAVNQLDLTPGDQVATVGQLHVFPNAVNVIPGQVELSLDIRDLSNSHLDTLLNFLQEQIQIIAKVTQTQIQVEEKMRNQPALANPEIQATIAQVCDDFGLSYHSLPSRAGHDAQELAKITDMGMIFVPSQAGISHAETEFTSELQCIKGANVLLQTLVRLDKIVTVGVG
jgi:N-carbamoyl-L-amino-acid hydrolase